MEDLEHLLSGCVYTLVAALITADGTIENAEVGVAGNLCKQYWPDLVSGLAAPNKSSAERTVTLGGGESALLADGGNFDIRDFCRKPGQLSDTTKVIGILSEILDDEGKALLADLLHEVANADANIAPEESTLLSKIDGVMGRTA